MYLIRTLSPARTVAEFVLAIAGVAALVITSTEMAPAQAQKRNRRHAARGGRSLF